MLTMWFTTISLNPVTIQYCGSYCLSVITSDNSCFPAVEILSLLFKPLISLHGGQLEFKVAGLWTKILFLPFISSLQGKHVYLSSDRKYIFLIFALQSQNAHKLYLDRLSRPTVSRNTMLHFHGRFFHCQLKAMPVAYNTLSWVKFYNF